MRTPQSGPVETPVTQMPPAADASATGARATAPASTWSSRSVNGRFLDLAFRLPDDLRSLEPALRELLAAQFKRGKIELRLTRRRRHRRRVAATPAGAAEPPGAPRKHGSRLAAPGTWAVGARGAAVVQGRGAGREARRARRSQAARRCIAGLRQARAREGERLVAVLLERVGHLRELAVQAEPLVPAAVKRQQQRFLERWQRGARRQPARRRRSRAEALAGARPQRSRGLCDPHRRRRGAGPAALAPRRDRRACSRAGGEVGKRLDFLIQELLREANTLGSKAAALELTNISVEMKVAIEQLREQVQNIE